MAHHRRPGAEVRWGAGGGAGRLPRRGRSSPEDKRQNQPPDSARAAAPFSSAALSASSRRRLQVSAGDGPMFPCLACPRELDSLSGLGTTSNLGPGWGPGRLKVAASSWTREARGGRPPSPEWQATSAPLILVVLSLRNKSGSVVPRKLVCLVIWALRRVAWEGPHTLFTREQAEAQLSQVSPEVSQPQRVKAGQGWVQNPLGILCSLLLKLFCFQ